ncbi:mycothione reductase [Nocardioides salsibiostraticola]
MTDTNTEHFDLIIIGSGSGNSIPEYLSHKSIAIVERGTFGGTCLNVGCIPSKMFVLPADVAVQAQNSAKLGIETSFESADWAAIRDRVFGRIDAISAGGEAYRATGTENVTLIQGTARFTGDRTFDVEGRTISADQVLLAAGSRPSVPPIPGLTETGFHTSDSVMRLESLPARIGIIGGGYIASEMGHVFSGLGSQVTLINRSPQLLRGQDDEIARRFTEVFGQRVDLRLGSVPTKVERRGNEIVIHNAGEEIVVDELLVAAGREPNSDLLDVETGGLTCHHHGTVVVDEYLQTAAEGVWAIGDLVNQFQLKHVANREATTAFWNIAHPHDQRAVDHKAVPAAVFSNPQIASVGITEEQAHQEGHDFVVGKRDYAGTAYGWALVDETSFAKVLVDRKSGLILGAHIIGTQAATLIQPLIQAMQFDQTAREVAEGPYWIHPALTEVVENALIEAVNQL